MAYYLSDTLSDILWSFICATLIATISYHVTNQPKQTNRFLAFILSWILSHSLFNAFGHMITLLLYPNAILSIFIGFSVPSVLILFTNYLLLKDDQASPFRYMSEILMEMFIHNSLISCIYGMDRCPIMTISIKLESYKLNHAHSFLTNIIKIFITIVIIKFMCLITLFYKNCALKFMLNLVRKNHNLHYKKNEIKKKQVDTEKSINYNQNYENDNSSCDILNDTLVQTSQWNIAWTNLTIKLTKFMFREEKIILRDINGFVESGTMMALMGPSGAGKSTLLKALMGINRKLITKQSNIYYNKNFVTKSCFIAQDVRQHIISGLTVGQSIYFASKIKNSMNNSHNVDNSDAIETLMKDLMIEDIRDVSIGNCSSCQQKRCILAMELCAQQKPNIVCVDEPTSGLDSHSSLIVRSGINKGQQSKILLSLKNLKNPPCPAKPDAPPA